ncbi:probable protein phosphatase 2C 55 isoform X1 [Daucus carota subsp. sativus]|uniref:probable protein phosphatase 2C 55 isoform X1 n=1 Tax=Daucus carota subsp. sativus TaxID=79200 RepID=UPI0007EFEB10|nr:PREDICTED: probable protein phosphatase 2C 55 isoform X1 [Daucus carota subsp. sativus]
MGNNKTKLFRSDVKERINILSGSFYIPKDDRSKPEGDDAHFICEEKQTIGIADGVGGWTKKGVNAGEYARELMINSINALHTVPRGAVDPKRVLSQAYSKTKLPGSCTACLLSLNGNILRAANLGDSGFMVIRNGNVLYKSPVQQHGFNHPYQLGQGSGDHPSSAMRTELTMEAGDVIIVGTDGLFDNMYSEEILLWVTQEINQSSDPQMIAWRLAEAALYNSMDKFADTPFARASRENGGNHSGGKIDDITVIVALILQDYSV